MRNEVKEGKVRGCDDIKRRNEREMTDECIRSNKSISINEGSVT